MSEGQGAATYIVVGPHRGEWLVVQATNGSVIAACDDEFTAIGIATADICGVRLVEAGSICRVSDMPTPARWDAGCGECDYQPHDRLFREVTSDG